MSSEPDSTDQRLADWLASELGEPVRLEHSISVSGAGYSAETLLIDARVGPEPGRSEALVIRKLLPGCALVPDPSLRQQAAAIRAVSAGSDLPVPSILGINEDGTVLGAPFLAMRRLPGRVAPQKPNYNTGGWLFELAPADRKRVWLGGITAMARVHAIVLGDDARLLRKGPASAENALAGFIDWIESWLDWVMQGRQHPICSAALAHLRKHRPEGACTQLLWGDPNPANILFDEHGDVSGLLDWEFAALGPGEIDLAWWIMFDDLMSAGNGVPRAPGLPDRRETIAAYEAAAGRAVSDMDYYDILVWLRMTIATIRMIDRQVELRRFKAKNDAWLNNPPAAMLAQKLGLPEPQIGPDFLEALHVMMAK